MRHILYTVFVFGILAVIIRLIGYDVTSNFLTFFLIFIPSNFLGRYIYITAHGIHCLKVELKYNEEDAKISFTVLVQFKLKQYILFGTYSGIQMTDIILRGLLYSSFNSKANIGKIIALIKRNRLGVENPVNLNIYYKGNNNSVLVSNDTYCLTNSSNSL